MEVPGYPHIYVLGAFERRVTIYSQQVRALNLAYALATNGILRTNSRIAIIGGGITGITLAGATATLGARPFILEKQGELLSLQRGNTSRWIHPRILDWPLDGYRDAEAGLPFLNWRAGITRDVTEKLLHEFNELSKKLKIDVHFGCKHIHPVFEAGELAVSWNEGHFESEAVDIIVFCLGFGLETPSPVGGNSYWRDDDLHQARVGALKGTTVISGTGDGGLTDLLRAALTDFRHEKLLEEIEALDASGEVRKKIIEIENNKLLASPRDVTFAYKKLPHSENAQNLIRERIRQHEEVKLNGLSAFPLDRGSSPVNKYLASLLLGTGVEYLAGRFKNIREAGGSIHFETDDGIHHSCQRLVFRHGAVPALKTDFPDIWKRCEEVRERASLDLTRFPAWPDGFWPHSSNDNESPAEAKGTEFQTPDLRNILFELYTPECEGFYVARDIDKEVSERLRVRGVWLSGSPGIGKSAMLRRALLREGGPRLLHEITLAVASTATPADLVAELHLQLLDILAHRLQDYKPELGLTQRATEIVGIISAHCRDGAHTIYVDELPLLDASSAQEFARILSLIFAILRRRCPNTHLRLVVSSINSPVSLSGASHQGFLERVDFIQGRQWEDVDVGRLVDLLDKTLGTALSAGQKSAIVNGAEGSPRVVKNFFRNFLAVSRPPAGPSVEELLSLTRKDLGIV